MFDWVILGRARFSGFVFPQNCLMKICDTNICSGILIGPCANLINNLQMRMEAGEVNLVIRKGRIVTRRNDLTQVTLLESAQGRHQAATSWAQSVNDEGRRVPGQIFILQIFIVSVLRQNKPNLT